MIGLGQEGSPCDWGELRYFKKGWNRKEEKGHRDFRKGGKLGQGVGALKKGGGAGTPLRTMPCKCDKNFSSFSIIPRF